MQQANHVFFFGGNIHIWSYRYIHMSIVSWLWCRTTAMTMMMVLVMVMAMTMTTSMVGEWKIHVYIAKGALLCGKHAPTTLLSTKFYQRWPSDI
jgi:hypothetical protein